MSAATHASAGPWSKLPTPLTPWILDVVQSGMGHTAMTPVQASAIPLFMKNKDVVVEAVTGSGKTLAFVLPILERLVRRERPLRRNELGALIISPTRELASQIHAVIKLFLDSQPARDDGEDGSPSAPQYPPPLLLVSSSTSSPAQDVQRFLETGADIVVGTPGRVEEFLLGRGRAAVSAKELEILVLDEADRLLDLGFYQSITRILNALPKQRRTGLFSATMTEADALSELVRAGLRNPARVVVKVTAKRADASGGAAAPIEERRIPANLKIYAITSPPAAKLVQLTRIIKHETATHASSRMIIYLSTAAQVDYLYRILPRLLPKSHHLFTLHGHLQPSARTRTLTTFSSHPATPQSPAILLATDVAARGLDLPDVDAVLQLDAPADARAFSHRCGRTARAGRSGRAWVLLAPSEDAYVEFLGVRKIPVRRRGSIREDGTFAAVEERKEGESMMHVGGAEKVEGDTGERGIQEAKEDPDADAIAKFEAIIRTHLLSDRDLSDRGARAFVSFVRAYGTHDAGFLFRASALDLVGLARAYGLLRLPRMPELKGRDTSSWKDADVDWEEYAYKDEKQEAKRRAEAEKRKEEGQEKRESKKRKVVEAPWSDQTKRKEGKLKRKEKKIAKRKWLGAQKRAGEEGTADAESVDDGDGSHIDDGTEPREDAEESDGEEEAADWKELEREERAAKRAKRGGATQVALEADFGDL